MHCILEYVPGVAENMAPKKFPTYQIFVRGEPGNVLQQNLLSKGFSNLTFSLAAIDQPIRDRSFSLVGRNDEWDLKTVLNQLVVPWGLLWPMIPMPPVIHPVPSIVRYSIRKTSLNFIFVKFFENPKNWKILAFSWVKKLSDTRSSFPLV